MSEKCQYTHAGPSAPGWECPHPTQGADRCPLHAGDSPAASGVSTFLREDAVRTEGGELPAIGARNVTVRVDRLSSPLDLRDARVRLRAATESAVPRLRLGNARLDRADLARTSVAGGVTAPGATIGTLDISYARLDGVLDLRGATVDEFDAEGLDARNAVDLDGVTITDRCRLIGARITGGLAVTDAHIEGMLLADKLSVDGDLGLAGSTVAGLASLRQAWVRRECNAAGVRFEDVVTFRGGRFGGTVSLIDATFEGEARFDGDTTFGSDARFADATFVRRGRFTDATFEGQAVFTGVRFGDLAAFQRTTFRGPLTFSEGTRFEQRADFEGSRFRRPVTFDTARMGTVDLRDITAEAAVTFRSAAADSLRLDGSHLCTVDCTEFQCTARLTMDRCTVDRISMRGARFGGAVTLRETTVADDIDASGTVFGDEFDCRRAAVGGTVRLVTTAERRGGLGGAFGLAHASIGALVYRGRPLDADIRAGAAEIDEITVHVPRVTPDATVDLREAELLTGHLGQPDGGTLRYDLRDATLGSVQLSPGPSADPFEPYWILETAFEAFRFVDHREMLGGADWRIHGTPPGESPTPTQLETTYLAAKNGAASAGDHPAAAVFFVSEMRYRRMGYKRRAEGEPWPRRASLWLARVANRGLDETARYGEAPSRVLATAVLTVVGFAAAAALIGPLALSPAALGEYLLLSLQGFTSFVLGSPRVETSTALHWLTAVEGFVGAFFIGLFVFALTRSVHR